MVRIEYYMVERHHMDGSITYGLVPATFDKKTMEGSIRTGTPYSTHSIPTCCERFARRLHWETPGFDMHFRLGNVGEYYRTSEKEVDTNINIVEWEDIAYARDRDRKSFVEPIHFCPYCGEKIRVVKVGRKVVFEKVRKKKIEEEYFIKRKKKKTVNEYHWDEYQ